MFQKISAFLDGLALTIIVIHITVCSEFFDGTSFWSTLTYLVELFFVLIGVKYLRRKLHICVFEVICIAYFCLLFLISLFNGLQTSQLISLIGRTLEIATMLMLFHLHKNNLKGLILTTTLVLSTMIYINYSLLLINPEGIVNLETGEPYYFLGTNYNQIGIKIVLAFILTIISTSFSKLLIINMVALVITGVHSLLIVGSMTSLVCFSFIILMYLMPKSGMLYKIIIPVAVSFIVFFQVFVVFGGESLTSTVTDSFLNLLGKDSSFTGRTVLWSASSGMFWDSPIWGYGYISANDYLNNPHFLLRGINPHNYVYNILHKGGILLFLIVFLMIKNSYRRIKPYIATQKVAFLIVMTNVALFAMLLFEVYESFFVFFLLSLMYYYPNIFQLSKNEKKKLSISYYSNLQK